MSSSVSTRHVGVVYLCPCVIVPCVVLHLFEFSSTHPEDSLLDSLLSFRFLSRECPSGVCSGRACLTALHASAQINTTTDEKDKTNPFRFANIGVEKFLELNSEQNHDDYCLAYVFSDRDFDDGVLGLAWVGAPSGITHTHTHTAHLTGSVYWMW